MLKVSGSGVKLLTLSGTDNLKLITVHFLWGRVASTGEVSHGIAS
jgi:hypothetical protein